ncbi:MAG: hypothetical protein R3344_06885 [Acidobacteriota bacterium]|nr:hypothetical protein [Acidobacteriota bacterium]
MDTRSKIARGATTLIAVLALVATVPHGVAQPAPTAEDIPSLAFMLFEHLREKDVRLPDGTIARVAGLPSRQSGAVSALLTPSRVEACLRTFHEAQAWPTAWMVVQDKTYAFDLVFPVALTVDGRVADPDPVFAVERRDWTVEELRSIVKERTGRKPRGRESNLVIQGFSQRIIEHYVYDVPPRPDRGLMSLLPEGALLREAIPVDLGDGRPHTLALVLERAEFIPSRCDDCAPRLFGHADTGKIYLVLTDDQQIVDQMELTPYLIGEQGRALLPRYECIEEDRDPEARKTPIDERFAERALVPLLVLEDLDRDGRALEFSLVSSFTDCDRHESIVLGITPGVPRLRAFRLAR